MSFADEVTKSVSDSRVLVEIDVTPRNVDQWVNNGAGLWAYSLDLDYPWLDSTLYADSWVAADFVRVGSVISDGVLFTRNASSANLGPREYHYDENTALLYICLEGYQSPLLHQVLVGYVYGFAFDDFTPGGMTYPLQYEGRLTQVPNVTIAQDQLYYGRIAFGGGRISIINTDGEYSTFAKDHDIYGNSARIYLGFASIDRDDYLLLYTGVIDQVTTSVDQMDISVVDKRKQLTRPIQITASAQNPVTTIQEILTDYFNVTYDTDYFDTTVWGATETAVANDGLTVTVNMQTPSAAIDVIESLCLAGLVSFYMSADGKYTIRQIDPAGTTGTFIPERDIQNIPMMRYDPSDVMSSIRVGYARDWVTAGNAYSYYTDDSHESSVFNAYLVYNEKSYDTFLDTLSSATSWATAMYSLHNSVHGTTEITVPVAYYDDAILAIQIDPQLDMGEISFLGTIETVVQSVSWNLTGIPTISLGLRQR
jgi:hypothetical protein